MTRSQWVVRQRLSLWQSQATKFLSARKQLDTRINPQVGTKVDPELDPVENDAFAYRVSLFLDARADGAALDTTERWAIENILCKLDSAFESTCHIHGLISRKLIDQMPGDAKNQIRTLPQGCDIVSLGGNTISTACETVVLRYHLHKRPNRRGKKWYLSLARMTDDKNFRPNIRREICFLITDAIDSHTYKVFFDGRLMNALLPMGCASARIEDPYPPFSNSTTRERIEFNAIGLHFPSLSKTKPEVPLKGAKLQRQEQQASIEEERTKSDKAAEQKAREDEQRRQWEKSSSTSSHVSA